MTKQCCPDASPEARDWTPAQATEGTGVCGHCSRTTTLRMEPYSHEASCKSCWELIVHGQE